MKFEWEVIKEENTCDNSLQSTYRARVFGGWVLRVEMLIDADRDKLFDGWSNIHNSLVFIPDPNYEWKIDK